MDTVGMEIVDRVLVRYSGKETKVVVDSDILTIADNAFVNNEHIESIDVKSLSLRTIGKEAFSGCKRLREAHFQAIKGGIGVSAFEGCSRLSSFVIPNGVMEIGSGAFRGCAAHFVLQIPSSVDVIGDNIVDSSAIIVSARPNEEINKYVEKNRIAIKKDLNTVLKQLETRRLIEREGEERQFNIFGESITASNTLRIYQEVLEYYQREKQRLIDLALAGLPTQLSLSETQRKAFLGVLESVNNGTKTLIKRVERWGIILPESTTFIDVLLPAAKLAKCGNLIIQGLTEGKNAADEMISDARNTLANEAESRVTGLSYGMLGSGLDMVLYSIDDFRERQRQRKAAYAEADRKLQQYASQTNSFANQQFAKLMKETAIPVFLSAISECCDALQKTELDTLKNEDLLVGTEPDIDDIVKSSKIIESALSDSSRDKEYSVALALKKCPFNKGAYSIAANNGLVTDTLLALFAHVGLADEDGNDTSPDTHLLEKMMKTGAVSVDGLSDFCSNATVFGSALPKSVAEIVKEKLINLLSPVILSKISMPYDGNNQQQIINVATKAASGFVSKSAMQKFSSAGISITDCASHIANEKIRVDKNKTYDAILAAINGSSSLSDDISSIKVNDAVIGELSAKNLLQKSITKSEKKLIALVEYYAAHDTQPQAEQIKKELTDIISDDDLAYIRSKGGVVLQSSFSSVDELMDILQKRIENTRKKNAENEKKYRIACGLQEKAQSADDYEKAAVLFDELTLYKDSTARQVECIKKQQAIQEEAYKSATVALEKAKSKKALDDAAKQFSAISDYKDSNKQLSEIENRKKALKSKKTGILFGFIGIVIIAAVVYYTQVVVPGNKYRAAEALLETGQYEEAIEAFVALGDFRDSASRAEETYYVIYDSDFLAAEEMWKAGLYDEAIEAYKALAIKIRELESGGAIDPKKNEDSIKSIGEAISAVEIDKHYAEACNLLAEGKLRDALKAFIGLGEFKDSPQRVLEIQTDMYSLAESLENYGKIADAAITFGTIADFKDSRERSFGLWERLGVREIVSGGYVHTVALTSAGTVISAGNNSYKERDVGSWKNIVSVHATGNLTFGIRENGTVIWTGDSYKSLDTVSSWKDIVAIAGDTYYTMGLRIDGTVVIAGSDWKYRDCYDWTDIIAIDFGYGYVVGLRSDGTVVASGDNEAGQCNVNGWKDIVAIAAEWKHTVGLKADGTVVAVGDNSMKQCEVSSWTGIVAIDAGDDHTVGLKADGTVVASGAVVKDKMFQNNYGQCNVSDWKNIVAIAAGDRHTVGIKADGTAIAVGWDKFHQCEVSGWSNIVLPSK